MSSQNKLRVAVLISGNGSNLQAIIDNTSLQHHAEIVLVLSNNPDAYGLQRAARANIPTEVLNHKDYADREQYDKALLTTLEKHRPDLVVLSGFMRILTNDFVKHYLGRMINIHPALLPNYKGLDTHQRAIDANETEHGASVHFVTPELDDGPLIVQASVPVLADDTAETLADRVHQVEHVIYPLAIDWIAQGRVMMKDGQTWLDGQPMNKDQQLVQLT